jgi:hypothetical protein
LDVLDHYHANGNREDEVVQFEFWEIFDTIELEVATRQTTWSSIGMVRETKGGYSL